MAVEPPVALPSPRVSDRETGGPDGVTVVPPMDSSHLRRRFRRPDRRRVLLAASGISVIWGLVTFPLLDSTNYVLMWLALAGCLALISLACITALPETRTTSMTAAR